MPLIDISEQRFGRLVVKTYEGLIRGKSHWLCQCDCGKKTTVRGDMLKCGNTKSCGCQLIESATKHGHSYSRPDKPSSPTYVTWISMKVRCTNPDSEQYDRYGGRGITICDRWTDFANFLADMGEKPKGTSIDRIDNNRGYEPGNCRWATSLTQSRNRRTSRFLTHSGSTMTVSEWAEKIGIPRSVLQDRIRLGWTDGRIVTTPHAKRS